MVQIGRITAGLCRLGACVAAIGAGVAIGSNSFTERKPKPDTPHATRVETAAKATNTVIPGPQGERRRQPRLQKPAKPRRQLFPAPEMSLPRSPRLANPGSRSCYGGSVNILETPRVNSRRAISWRAGRYIYR